MPPKTIINTTSNISIEDLKHNHVVKHALNQRPFRIALLSNVSSKDAIEQMDKGPWAMHIVVACSHDSNKVNGFTFTNSNLEIYKYAVLVTDSGQPFIL